MIGQRKGVTAAVIISILVISTIKWRSNITNKRIPAYVSRTYDNPNLAKKGLDKGFVNILIIQRINAFALSYIQVLQRRSQNDRKRLIIFCPSELLLGDNIRTSETHIIQISNARMICRLFHLPGSNDNWILQYSNGFLVLKAKFNSGIVRKIGLNQAAPPQKGRAYLVSGEIARMLNAYEDGVYYCAQRLEASCACYEAYESLRDDLIERGSRLRLLVMGDFNDIDIENFRKEEADTAIITKPNPDINDLVAKWGKDTERMDINIIIFKKATSSRIFPLVDRRDYQAWLQFKRNEYNNVIDAFKAK